MCFACRLWLTAYGYQHGDGGEGPGQALAAHEDAAVPLRQEPHQAKQTALQHSPECWGEEDMLSSMPLDSNQQTFTHTLTQRHLQLMNQIVAMVTSKNLSSSMGTLTSTAVRTKSSRTRMRLPAMRTASDILK